MLGRWAAAAAVVVGGIAASAPGGARAADGPCARFGSGVVSGHVKSSKLTEISGVVASRRHPGVYWTHNDSGNDPRIYGLSTTGQTLGAWQVPNAQNVDWESMTSFRDAGGRCWLVVADIGDNDRQCSDLQLYRIPEPTIAGAVAPTAGTQSTERGEFTGDKADRKAQRKAEKAKKKADKAEAKAAKAKTKNKAKKADVVKAKASKTVANAHARGTGKPSKTKASRSTPAAGAVKSRQRKRAAAG